MANNELKHAGVLGMKWGRRQARPQSSGGSGRKTSFAKDADGRKVNRILGKRNRTKIRKAIFGDEKKVTKTVMGKKYNDISSEDKRKAENRTKAAMLVVGTMSIAAIGYMLKNA